MNRSDPLCRPFRPRFCFSHVTTRSRAWLLPAGASRLVCLPNRSKHKVPNHFETSLEEAAVSRHGREAGMKNGQILRAPKALHRSDTGIRDDHDFFTDSETHRAATRGKALHTRWYETVKQTQATNGASAKP